MQFFDPLSAVSICIGGSTPVDNLDIYGTSPTLRLANAASTTNYTQVQDLAGRSRWMKTAPSGTVTIDIDPLPQDGTSAGQFRFFRATTTTGLCFFQIFKGDGTGTINAQIAGNTDCYVNVVSGKFGVGTNAPGALFSVGNGSQFQLVNAGTVTKYNNVTTVARGMPSCVAVDSKTAQSAAITATTLYTPPVSGLYRISYVATITTAATTSCTLGGTTGFQVKYANDNDSVVKTTNPTTPVVSSVNATATSIAGSFIINAKSGIAIQYLMGYTSVGATAMQYDLNVIAEAL